MFPVTSGAWTCGDLSFAAAAAAPLAAEAPPAAADAPDPAAIPPEDGPGMGEAGEYGAAGDPGPGLP